MMESVVTSYHALTIYAKILVLFHMIPAARKLYVKFPYIDPFVNVLKDGLEILILSAIPVGFCCIPHFQ